MGEWMRAALGAAVLVCSSTAFAEDWRLRMDGIGPLTIGMSFEAANRALKDVLEHSPEGRRPPSSCEMIPVGSHPGVALMFINDKLSRVDVFEAGTRNEEGIAVGDSVDKVMATYPNAKVEPNAYDDREKYLTVQATSGPLAIRFETENGTIGQFYAGEFKSVQFVEHCL